MSVQQDDPVQEVIDIRVGPQSDPVSPDLDGPIRESFFPQLPPFYIRE